MEPQSTSEQESKIENNLSRISSLNLQDSYNRLNSSELSNRSSSNNFIQIIESSTNSPKKKKFNKRF